MKRLKTNVLLEHTPLYVGGRFAHTYLIIKKGAKGEPILAGGLPAMVGITGGPNNFKSALATYLAGYAMDKVNATHEAWLETYDTEATLLFGRLASLTKKFKYLPKDTFDPEGPLWSIVSLATHLGDQWLLHFKEVLKEKVKDKENYAVFTAFGKSKRLIPTVAIVDTLSKLDSSKTNDMLLSAKTEDASTNMYYAFTGLFKSKFMAFLPGLVSKSNTSFILTAHLGKKKDFGGGGKFSIPEKKVSYLSADAKIRGVPDEFLELPQIVYLSKNGRKFINQADKLPAYPYGENDNGVDLHIIKVVVIRNKGGKTGIEFPVVFEQSGGLHEELTNLLFLKEKFVGFENNFGIGGNAVHFSLKWYPDTTYTRKTFRKKIENDYRAKRALELLADLRQHLVDRLTDLQDYFGIDGYLTDPDEIYKAIIDNGYSWDEILDTRGWWSLDQYNKKLPNYLSIYGLLEMANGVKPYWK